MKQILSPQYSLLTKFILLTAIFFSVTLMSAQHASAQTPSLSDLRAVVTSLLEQIQQLKNQTQSESVSSTGSAGTCEYAWNRNLTIGDEGSDVAQLQKFLNAKGVFIANSGPGSPGQESNYYGQKTAQAVARFQEQHRSEILSPNGLSQGSWFFGPSTRAKIRSLCGVGDGNESSSLKNTCSDGRRTYSEGKSTNTIYDSNGMAITLDDARYVCRSGSWKTESTSSEPTSTSVNCSDGRRSYSEGKSTNTIYDSNGTAKTLSDAKYVCRSGVWKTQSTWSEPAPASVNCSDGRKTYTEGQSTDTLYNGDLATTLSDAKYVCSSGVWKTQSTWSEPSSPTAPTDTTSCLYNNKIFKNGEVNNFTSSSGGDSQIRLPEVCRSGKWETYQQLPG